MEPGNLFWLVYGLENNIFYVFQAHGTPRPYVPLFGVSMILAICAISLLFALTFLLVTAPPRWKKAIGYLLVLATFVWFKTPIWAPRPF